MACLLRWALAAFFGLRARFDAVAGFRLLIRRSKKIGWCDHNGHLQNHNRLCDVAFQTLGLFRRN